MIVSLHFARSLHSTRGTQGRPSKTEQFDYGIIHSTEYCQMLPMSDSRLQCLCKGGSDASRAGCKGRHNIHSPA